MDPKYVRAAVIGFAVAFVLAAGMSLLALAGGQAPGITPTLSSCLIGGLVFYLLANLAGNRKVATGDTETVSAALEMRAPPGEALVYVYREGFVGKAAGLNIVLDGRPVAQLTSPRFTCLSVTPGAHLLAAGFGGLAGAQNRGGGVEVAAVAGAVYAFRCTVSLGALQNTVKVEPVADLAQARVAMGAMKMTLPDPAAVF